MLSVYRLRSEVLVSVLHAGRELQVGDTNIVVTAVQENVSLRRKRRTEKGIVMRKLLRYTGHHHEAQNSNKPTRMQVL